MNVVQVNKKYQCPIYCDVEHDHFVYYTDKVDDVRVMTIDKPEYKKLKKVYVLEKQLLQTVTIFMKKNLYYIYNQF